MADRLVDVYMLLRETYETLRYATVYMQVHAQHVRYTIML